MVTTLAPGFPAPSVLPGQGLPDAVNTFLSGDLRAAARELDTLLARRTFRGDERTRADFLLGWISLRLGHYQRASAHFYRLRKLEEHPLREMAAHLEARADLLRGRPRTAIAECGQYAADFPDGRYSDECQLIRADAHLALGERAAAVELYQGFLDLNPDDQRREGISLRIAKALEDAGELKAAARSYRALFLEHHLPTTGLAADAALQRIEAEGLDLPTLSDDQLYVRACSLRDSGELEASYQLFCDLDDRHPAAGPEATDLGRKLDDERHNFLWRNRRYEEVGRANAALYEKNPKGSGAAGWLYWAVQGFSRAGLFEEAIRYQKLGTRHHGGHHRFRGSHERSALLYVGAGRYKEARSAYKAWQSSSSRARRSAKVKFRVAYCAYRAGDYKTAIKEFEQLMLRRGSQRVGARFYRGRAFEKLGDRDAAEDDFSTLLSDHPDSWYALVLRRRRMKPDQASSAAFFPRNGRWPWPRSPDADPREMKASRGGELLFAHRPSDDSTTPLPPRHTQPPGSRDADGRWVGPGLVDGNKAPSGWASLGLPDTSEFSPQQTVEGMSSGAQGRPTIAPPQELPPTWSPSRHWNRELGDKLWADFVEKNDALWPELPAAQDLSLIGLGELAGPMLAQIYSEVRDIRRSRKKRARVRRWRSSGRPQGNDRLARWSAILDLEYRAEEWQHLFAAAGYPASVTAFASERIEFNDLPRDRPENQGTWTLKFPAAFAPHVWKAAWEFNVDPLLVLAIMRAESLYRHDAISRAGAVGLVQVMPATASRVAARMDFPNFRVERLLEPETNIRIGTWYLGKLLDRFEGQFPLAVGAYNGGPHNIGRWLRPKHGMPLEEFVEEIAFDETRNYVKKVVQYYAIYCELYGRGSRVAVPLKTVADDATVIDF